MMAQFFEIHPENPQLRLIHRAVEIIRKGGVIAYPPIHRMRLAATSAINRHWIRYGVSGSWMINTISLWFAKT